MTDKEKLKEIKKLADAMYYAAFNLTTDASLLRKAMKEYHQFIIHEYCKEEPVSESTDFEQELYKAFGQIKDFTLGVAIAKRFYDMGRKLNEPVSEDLEESAFDYAEACKYDGGEKLLCVEHFKAGANWQKQKDFQHIKKECERTGSCCDDDIAIEATKRHPYYYASEMEAYANIGFKEGAMWQKEQFEKDYADLCNGIVTAKGFAVTMAYNSGVAGAKKQMMKDAVDACVTDIRTYKEENEVDFTVMYEKGIIPYEIEQEVKLIIIKED